MRIAYPDIVWGSIASSAGIHCLVALPQYHETLQKHAPSDCVDAIHSAVREIDELLDKPEPTPTKLKSVFGLEALSDHGDFAAAIELPLELWQASHWWEPETTKRFPEFCDTLTAQGENITLDERLTLSSSLTKYPEYVKKHILSQCPETPGNRLSFGL